MHEFICKAKLKGKKKVRPAIGYAEDRILAKKGQLGDKLLCAPVKLNMDEKLDSIEAIERAAGHLQGGRNAFLSLITSYSPRIILSSRQILVDNDRLFFHASKLAYVTVAQQRGTDGKRVRKPKKERQENVDLRKQPVTYSIHIDTDNVHAHCVMGMVSSVHMQNIRINNGFFIFAFAYARQEVLRERGLIAEDNLLYKLGQEGGRNFVVVDEKVKAARLARVKETGIAQDLGDGLEIGVGEELDEGFEQATGLPALGDLASVHHRKRHHPGKIFRAALHEFYPKGPKRLIERNNVGTTKAKLRDLQQGEQKENLYYLKQLLIDNNLCIKTGEYGGLVLIGHKDPIAMSEVDDRWTKELVEEMTGLAGNWIIGKPQEEQRFLAGKFTGTWGCETTVEEYAPNYANICNSDQTPISLPWAEYRVKISHIGGNSQRRMTLEEVNELVKQYRAVASAGRLVLGKPKSTEERQLANIYLSPALDAGWRAVTIQGVKADKLKNALALDPNLILHTPVDGAELYSVTFTFRYPEEQREAGINSISLVANDLVRVLDAAGWTMAFTQPGLPVVRGVGNVPKMRSIVGQPHARVSEPLQALLPAAWTRLVAAERADAVDRAIVMAKAVGLNPDQVVARMAKDSPLRPPLRQMVKCSENALALAQRLVPLPAQKQKTKEPEKVVKTPAPSQIPPPELQPDDTEEKRRKRKLEEDEKKALLQADKDEIFEK